MQRSTKAVWTLPFGVVILLLILTPLWAQGPAAKPQQPSTDDQLAIVRLRAQILDAQARAQQAQQAFERAQKDIEKLQPEFTGLIKSLQAKLPAAAKGKIWQPQDDGKFGLTFVEVDAPPEVTAAGVVKEKLWR